MSLQIVRKETFLTLLISDLEFLCSCFVRRVSKVEMCVLKPCVCTMGISVMAVSFVSVKVHNKKKKRKTSCSELN